MTQMLRSTQLSLKRKKYIGIKIKNDLTAQYFHTASDVINQFSHPTKHNDLFLFSIHVTKGLKWLYTILSPRWVEGGKIF